MRQFVLVVFDDLVQAGTTVYSSPEHNKTLGSCDQIALHCVVDTQNAAGAIQVQIQTSGDGRNWLAKSSGNGEISTPSNVPAAPATANLQGFDQGASPSHALVRLAITLIAPLTTAHVKIVATGRDAKQG